MSDKISLDSYKHPKVKMTGEDGNGFMVVGRVMKVLKRVQEVDGDSLALQFKREATSGDYDHLIQTVMDYVEVE